MAIRMTSHMTRRAFGATAGTFLLSSKLVAQTETALLSRPIPGSGERIPAVGLGTAYVFDVNNDVTRSKADTVARSGSGQERRALTRSHLLRDFQGERAIRNPCVG